MSIAISVLVPVYNVEKTLDRCLKSILNQTFKNYEVILINDGSTDKSGMICDDYVEKYDNFRVIHKENEGLGPTRNLGIIEAKGQYIYHCDSDDWLKENLLEKTYEAITKNDTDILVFGYEIFTEKNNDIIPYDKIAMSSRVIKNEKEVKSFFVSQYYNSFLVLSACNRLYKRSFLIENDLFFPPLRRCQDMAYSMLLFDKANSVTALEECYYCYIIEPGVYKGRTFEEMVEIYLSVHNITAKTFEGWGIYDEEQKNKLINRSCEHLANYISYAITVKFFDKKEDNIQYLLNNKEAVNLLSTYSGNSTFIRIFCKFVKQRRKTLIKWLCKLQQRKSRGGNK